MSKILTLLGAAALVLTPALAVPTASAGDARIGVMLHDVQIFGLGGARGKEKSESISLEYVFDQPQWLDWAWGARPYVGGSVNLSGNTSHGGAGVLWRKGFFDSFYGEASFGLVVHDGTIRVPNPADATTAEEVAIRQQRKRTEIEFGSRALFRTQFAVGYAWTEEFSTEFTVEHLSNGKILGNDENEGVDSYGIRFNRRF
ncbi:acyloxyacyl hydrolase [Robiginitomaculum antarcticum]|uniref:acyloxyacyl hydrolase n=1 Tax=Robiginitomaculum antarcticum TaxID=437507 RepID=UPI0003736CEB|nr:acyloxyacyl hydrolase [Robiginitomaculum antarcticum]